MSAHWLPRARQLAAEGLSLSEIGLAVGRSKVAVWRQLRGARAARSAQPEVRRTRDPETVVRSVIRAEARAEAAETGCDVAGLYRLWGVERLEPSRLWDQRRGVA